MKRLKYLSQVLALGLCWFLFATSAVAADTYDSSIQRSKFLQNSDGDSSYQNILFRSIEDQRTRALWNLEMQGESFDTAGNVQSRTMSFNLGVNFRYKLIESLEVRGKGKLQLQAGRTQDLFGDLEANSGTYIREAILRWKPIDDSWEAEVDGGIISQQSFDNPIFLKSLGFPGVKESLAYKRDNWYAGTFFQQLIPTSATQSTRVQDQEPIPTLFTGSLEAGTQITKTNWVRGRLTAFDFNNLPSTVAYWSQRMGNLGAGGEVNNSAFLFDFRGWMAQLIFEQKMTDDFALQLKSSIMRNLAAPDKTNEGGRLNLTASYDIGRWLLQPGGEYFFVEHDVVPAYYNSWWRGHNNRVGWGVSFDLESKDYNFKAGINYFNAKLINNGLVLFADIQQDNLQTIMLTLETAYDAI